ncbi:MAG: DUF309 domain-containing protein [Candidatus Binatia bacterium]
MATAYAPGLPLPLRNALAELVIAALDDDVAAAALAWLVDPAFPIAPAVRERLAAVHLVGDDGTLLAVHRPHRDVTHRHARRGLRAAAAYRRGSAPAERSGIDQAAAHAVALWNESLFFEVHEVLEAVWKTASGPVRQALQGVIQIGVALHHHAHGNPRGARTLMREGRERLLASPGGLPMLDVEGLLAATAGWEGALAAGTAGPREPPPLRLAR